TPRPGGPHEHYCRRPLDAAHAAGERGPHPRLAVSRMRPAVSRPTTARLRAVLRPTRSRLRLRRGQSIDLARVDRTWPAHAVALQGVAADRSRASRRHAGWFYAVGARGKPR